MPKNYYTVLYKIKSNKYYISDPDYGLITYTKEEFLKFWIGNNATETIQEGISLFLDPTPNFYTDEFNEDEVQKFNFTYFCFSSNNKVVGKIKVYI